MTAFTDAATRLANAAARTHDFALHLHSGVATEDPAAVNRAAASIEAANAALAIAYPNTPQITAFTFEQPDTESGELFDEPTTGPEPAPEPEPTTEPTPADAEPAPAEPAPATDPEPEPTPEPTDAEPASDAGADEPAVNTGDKTGK